MSNRPGDTTESALETTYVSDVFATADPGGIQRDDLGWFAFWEGLDGVGPGLEEEPDQLTAVNAFVQKHPLDVLDNVWKRAGAMR
ncbi:hypothetical protein AB0H86_09205 [Streptomyces sp. NPDC050997]|uniref:hypothetical protein n=1 Tax=Streptomyces sp. NPDC050997 TaxID=3155519 RepID=UPI0034292F75